MVYYFADQALDIKMVFDVSGTEFKHIKVNRKLKIGNKIVFQDTNFKRFECEIIGLKNEFASFKVIKVLELAMVSASRSHLYLALIKEKGLDFVLQKATELNVKQIILFKSRYGQNFPSDMTLQNKVRRWEKIIKEAAKQSGRLDCPELRFKKNLLEAKSLAISKEQKIFIFDKTGEKFDLEKKDPLKERAIFIGPEGGFTEEEITTLSGIKLNLGPLILRSETAALSALSLFKLWDE